MQNGSFFGWLWLAALAVLAGCQRADPSGAAPAAPPPGVYHLDRAQPRLPTLRLWLGSAEITAEVARRTWPLSWST